MFQGHKVVSAVQEFEGEGEEWEKEEEQKRE
jgi:hypothetical protein